MSYLLKYEAQARSRQVLIDVNFVGVTSALQNVHHRLIQLFQHLVYTTSQALSQVVPK